MVLYKSLKSKVTIQKGLKVTGQSEILASQDFDRGAD